MCNTNQFTNNSIWFIAEANLLAEYLVLTFGSCFSEGVVPEITIAGAMSTGTHGSGENYGTMSTLVR